MSTSKFVGYAGSEESFWVRHHSRYKDSILAVGRGNATPETNTREYATARQQFERMVKADFSDSRSSYSVLDCGFGHGHYARACHELGFGRYVGLDFASPKKLSLGSEYTFKKQDLSVPFDLDQQFDLVICIDVIFHIVDDTKFYRALDNIKKHSKNLIYITSLFREVVFPPYVKHRSLSAYKSLNAQVVSRDAWRDNSIARFKLNESQEDV